MGDVVSIGFFRDRRKTSVEGISGVMDPGQMTKAELHNHMLTAHAWGGPKSTTKDRMLTAHHNSHVDPAGFEKPHSHGSA